MNDRLIIGAALLMAACGTVLPDGPPVNTIARQVALPADGVACEVLPGRTRFVVGEPFRAEVRIYNLSDEPLHLVGSLDGSERRIRYPYAYFDVAGPAFKQIGLAYCGNVNPFSTADVTVVAPGDYFNPFDNLNDDRRYFGPQEFEATIPTAPGDYVVTFHYSTTGATTEEWRVSEYSTEQDAEALSSVPSVEISCSIIFRVVAR